MKLSDIGRYYKSTQGIYLSDSGGRRVVDKMADLSLNRAHAEWSGTDQPEYKHDKIIVGQDLYVSELYPSVATVGSATITRVPKHYLLIAPEPIKAVQLSGSTLRVLGGTTIYEITGVQGQAGDLTLSPGIYEAVIGDDIPISSDQDIKEYFEMITRGTSIAVSADDLTIDRSGYEPISVGVEWNQGDPSTILTVIYD